MKPVKNSSLLNELNSGSAPQAKNNSQAPARQNIKPVEDPTTLSSLNAPTGQVQSFGNIEIDAMDAIQRAKNYTPNLAEQLQEQATSKDTALTVMGTVGGVVGSPLNVPGMIGGSALAAATTSAIYDYFEMINNPDPAPRDFVETQIKNAAQEGVTDASITTGTGAAFTLAGHLGRRVLGLGKEGAQRILEAGSRRGVNLGAFYMQEGGRRRAIGAFSKISGPFPLAGAGFKSSQRRINTEYIDSIGRFLDDLAPSSTVFSLSGRTAASARQTYRRYRGIYDTLYKEVEGIANSLPRPDAFLTRSIKGQAKIIGESIEQGSPTTRAGRVKTRRVSAPVRKFIDDMSNLSERQSLEQIRAVKQDAAALMESEGTSDTAKRYLEQIRIAAEQSLSDIDTSIVPQQQAEELVGALTRANQFFNETMTNFDTPTAQAFQKYDRNIFSAGRKKSGSLNSDEILNSVVNTNSRVGLQNLRFLVQRSGARDPDRIYNGIVRDHLEGVFNSAKRTVEEAEGSQSRFAFDYKKLKDKLDLDNPDRRAIYEQMMRGTDYSIEALEDFLKISEQADGAVIPSSSAFIGRRMALGGVASGVSAITPAGGFAGSAALVLGLNGLQKVLTSPGIASRLVRMSELDPNSFLFRSLGTRLAEDLSLGEEEQEETFVPPPPSE